MRAHTDIFASEYSALLARRLLEKTTFDIEDELKKVVPPLLRIYETMAHGGSILPPSLTRVCVCVCQVELLKVRFGEQAFSVCDVMIKDMQVGARVLFPAACHASLLRRTAVACICRCRKWPLLAALTCPCRARCCAARVPAAARA